MPRISRLSQSSRGSRSADYSSPTSVSFPRYTTYTPEELESTFARYAHIGAREGVDANSGSPAPQSGGGRTRLTKSHECRVSYPDGTSGLCRYTRGGPVWHVFRFDHKQPHQQQSQATVTAADGATFTMFAATAPSYLPTQNFTERMGNTLAAIEAKAAEFAHAAFAEAFTRERDERFKRASIPIGYNRYKNGNLGQLKCPQMSAKRAKEMAGKYALCLRLGTGENQQRFLPCINFVYDTLDEANEAWKQHEHRARRFVACLCRYSRQWELPVYNPLHADTEYAALLGLSVTDADEEAAKAEATETA